MKRDRSEYSRSKKGKEAQAKYNRKYRQTENGKEVMAKAAKNWAQTEAGKKSIARSNDKKKEKKQAKAAEEARKLPRDQINLRQNKEKLAEVVLDIATKPRAQFGGRSLDQLVDLIIEAEKNKKPLILVYLGYTRVQIKDEFLGFLIARGNSKQLPVSEHPPSPPPSLLLTLTLALADSDKTRGETVHRL